VSGPTVIVVDDHELFRDGLVGLLEECDVRTIGEAANGADGVRLAAALQPDVVLMDLKMPGMSGIEAIRRLAAAAPLVRVLVLSVVAEDMEVAEALLAGACGYLLKEAPIRQIVDGIEAAARGESALSPRIASRLVHRIREPPASERTPDGEDLTQRETEVLELLTRGMDNAAIARTLYVSQYTVKSHVSNILTKLKVDNRLQAAVRAVRGGLI
jgi:DNA-binding NarL/FixJ family response regulator